MTVQTEFFDAIESKDRAIAERCTRIEKACLAIGFNRDSGRELIVRLIARVAGEDALVRPMSEIAADKDVGISYSYACRCVRELVEFGLISVSSSKGPPTRRRGPSVMLQILSIDWAFVDKTIAAESRYLANLKGQNRDVLPRVEIVTEECRGDDEGLSEGCRKADETLTNDCPRADEPVKSECPERDHSICPPNTQIPCPQIPRGSSDRGPGDIEFANGPKIFTSVAATTHTAWRLFRGLDYWGDDGSTLWLVAAMYDAGQLSDADIKPIVERAYAKANTVSGRVGYFRESLREKLGLDKEQMKQFLKRVNFGVPTPETPPSPPTRTGLLQTKSVPGPVINNPLGQLRKALAN